MKKYLPFILIILVSEISLSQSLPSPVQAVVDAENGFASTSKEKNTRAAFLANLDRKGIVFNGGEPVNGLALWEKLPENNSLLFWWPVFADVSLSGDFGYTTGPYEVSKDRSNPVPVAFGYYSTVWKKDATGKWKVAIDMGISFPQKEEVIPSLSTSKQTASAGKGGSGAPAFLDVDRSYNTKLNEKGKSFDLTLLSEEARVHRHGKWPFITRESILTIDEASQSFQFEQIGGEVASTGDLAYCYGKVKVTHDGTTPAKALNYLRIWKQQKGSWKVVLDVVGG